MSAKLTPMLKNNNLALRNELPKYMPMQPKKTIRRPINMAFLQPSFGKKEAINKETKAIGKSLKASKTDALLSVILYTLMDFEMTIPTLFSKIAKTKQLRKREALSFQLFMVWSCLEKNKANQNDSL